jgi:nicotinamidase-related amidase
LESASKSSHILVLVWSSAVGYGRSVLGDSGQVLFEAIQRLPPEGTYGRGVSQFRTAMAWQRVKSADEVKPWFLRDSPGFHLIPEMNPLPNEAIFDKITMSAFEGTPLNIALRDCGIDSFGIVGIAMEIGIEPTVRHGVDLGYIPVVVTDACGFGHRAPRCRSAVQSPVLNSRAMHCSQMSRQYVLTLGSNIGRSSYDSH